MRHRTAPLLTMLAVVLCATSLALGKGEFADVRSGLHDVDQVLLEARRELNRLEAAHVARTDSASELRRLRKRVQALLRKATDELAGMLDALDRGARTGTIGAAVAEQTRRIVADRRTEIAALGKRADALEIEKSAATPRVSSFESGTDGWTLSGGTLRAKAEGANGYLHMSDKVNTWMTLTAPARFTGDLSAFDGGTLSFSAREIENPEGQWAEFGTVTLVTSEGEFSKDIAPGALPSTWTTFSLHLTAGSFGLEPEEWKRHLAKVTRIEICVESGEKISEVVGLDDILLAPGSKPAEAPKMDAPKEGAPAPDAPAAEKPWTDIAVKHVIARAKKGIVSVRLANVGRGTVPPTRLRIEGGRWAYDAKGDATTWVWNVIATEPVGALRPWAFTFVEVAMERDVAAVRATADIDGAVAERDEENNVLRVEVEDQPRLAVVVLGNIDLTLGSAHEDNADQLRLMGQAQQAALEAKRDLEEAGYDAILVTLNQTPHTSVRGKLKQLYYRYLANPDITAFVFIGHGVSVKGTPALEVGQGDADGLSWGITPDQVRRYRAGAATELVILHACTQGSLSFGPAWREAFGMEPDGVFVAPPSLTNPTAILEWQQAWDVPVSLRKP